MRRGGIAAASAALLAATALIAGSGPSTGEASAEPAAEKPKRLNVVVLMSDDQPLRSFELMPFLSSRRWVSFDNAILNNPFCCPSRASILTGLYSHNTGVETNAQSKLFDNSRTIATSLRRGGYATGYFGKYLNHYPWGRGARWRPPGWTRWAAMRSPAKFHRYMLNVDGRLRRYGSKPRHYLGRVIQRQAMRFIRERRRAKPFFAFVAPFAPHDPSIPDRRDRETVGLATPPAPNVNETDVSDKPQWVRGLEPTDLGRIQRMKRRYARASLSNDRIAKALVRLLRRRGELDRTVFIYLTDNGYSIGEHRHIGKTCGYEECVRTPLLVRYPGAGERRIREPVANVDLAPTIAAIARVKPPYGSDGSSLLPLLRGDRPQRDRTILLRNAEYGPPRYPVPPMWGVRTTQFKYLEYDTGERELYDLQADPFELDNVAGTAEYAETESRLAAELAALKP